MEKMEKGTVSSESSGENSSKKNSRKGVINAMELIVVAITLFVAFSTFFPRAAYKNRWEEAYMILKARDMLLLLERTGRLHAYAFEPGLVGSFFEALFPESNLIVWTETEGGMKNDIKIACDCPSGIIAELNGWAAGLKINERNITVSFCAANLGSPGPCIDDSDAILIWGQKSLQSYEQMLSDYISNGNGLIEVMEFKQQDQVDGDSVQRNIFGLRWVDIEKNEMDREEFSREPENAADIIFDMYKYFYHVPLPLKTTGGGFPISGCSYSPAKNGTLNISSGDYYFAICNASYVWFDTNGDKTYDSCIKNRSEVTLGGIGGYKFLLSYVNSDSSISVSFKPDYAFDNFLDYIVPVIDPPGKALGVYRVAHIEPIDNDEKRILLKSIDADSGVEYPSVILNQLGETGVAWIADFSEDGFGDDEKLLLTSLLLWASNKHATSSSVANLRFGYLTSYVNVKNLDMFEVYKFSLGLGYPF